MQRACARSKQNTEKNMSSDNDYNSWHDTLKIYTWQSIKRISKNEQVSSNKLRSASV